jgi:predicted MPP superfamily phosphohydrolase
MKKAKRRRRLGLLVFLLVVVIGFIFYDSNTRIVTDDYVLDYANLPAGFNDYRIVQLSDIHASTFGSRNETLLGAVKAARPDIIVITGDIISYYDGPDVISNVSAACPIPGRHSARLLCDRKSRMG